MKFEELDARLDMAKNAQLWLDSLATIRTDIDKAYNEGAIAEYQYKVLLTKSARIQDAKNDEIEKEIRDEAL